MAKPGRTGLSKLESIEPDGWRSWLALACLTVCGAMVVGLGYYAFPLFLAPLQKEFHWSHVQLGLVVGAFWLAAPASLVLPPLLRRFQFRTLIIAAVLLSAIAVASIFFSNSLISLLFIRFLMGVAKVVIFALVYISTAKLFERRFALASGIGAAGWYFGGIVLPPALQSAIDAFGWRTAALIIAACTLLLVPLVVAGLPTGRLAPASEPDRRKVWAGAFGGVPRFIVFLCVVSALVYTACTTVVAYLPGYATSAGHTAQTGAQYVSALALASMIGATLGGGLINLTPKTGRAWLVVALYSVQALAVLALSFGGGKANPLPAILAFGAAYGAAEIGALTVVKDQVGAEKFAGIFSILYFGLLLGGMSGPFLAGLLLDAGHGYVVLFQIIGSLLALVSAGFLTAVLLQGWRDGRSPESGSLI